MNYRNIEPLPELKFDKKRSRVKLCPCGKENKDGKFVPYVGFENKGYCHSCGETYLPELPKADESKTHQPKAYKPRSFTLQTKPLSFIPPEIFKASLSPAAFETNHFVQFLIKLFGVEVASQLVSGYFIASSKHWNGATVFWQIDTQGKIRTGKIMLYSPTTGRRIKEPFNHIHWAHKALKQPDFELRQCLFGEHLLKDNSCTVAIVESEKTAIIASVYLPQFIWVAVGSLSNLNAEKCSILKGRTVILFPDLKGYEKWQSKANELSYIARFFVSDLLERKASEHERKQGLDLADYLVKLDWRKFTNQSIQDEPQNNTEVFISVRNEVEVSPEIETLPLDWSIEINAMETYFSGIDHSNISVKLDQCSTITNAAQFVETHISFLRVNNGNPLFLPYLERIRKYQAQTEQIVL